MTNVSIESDAGPGLQGAATRRPGRHFFPGQPPGRKVIMKLRILPSSLFLLIVFLTAHASSCGIIDPAPGPDDPLPLLRLNPETLVSSVVQASTPDSSGSDSIAHMRFDLTSEAMDAVGNGAIVELALRVPDGQVLELTGWATDGLTLVPLEADRATAGSDSNDYWWRSAWIDPSPGQQIVTADGKVRLRVTPIPDPGQVVLRIVEISTRLRITLSAGRVLAASGNSLLLQSDAEGRLIRRNVQGDELGRIASIAAPLSLCHLDSWHYGVDERELRFLPSAGGAWQRLAALPWGNAYSYALTTDGTDLYLMRRPLQTGSEEYHVLYRLSAGVLRTTSSFSSALLDSTVLERNGLLGGGTPGLAYWTGERQLVVPGRQEDQFGLVTFTRAGRFRKFIPLPFIEGGIGFAFVEDYLFVTRGNPTLEALRWEGSFTPAVPSDWLLYRWPAP